MDGILRFASCISRTVADERRIPKSACCMDGTQEQMEEGSPVLHVVEMEQEQKKEGYPGLHAVWMEQEQIDEGSPGLQSAFCMDGTEADGRRIQSFGSGSVSGSA